MSQPDLSRTFAYFEDTVDAVTGFLPRELPLKRLPQEWEAWEAALDDAITSKIQVGAKFDISNEEVKRSSSWRDRVMKLPQLQTSELFEDIILARRAHLVLAFIMHFYIHSLPPESDILIPPSIGVPLLRVSNHLQIPADVTYSDTVLYNYTLNDLSAPLTPENLHSYTMFTNSLDEEEFYLASTRIELKGVPGLNYMREVMKDLAGGPDHDIPMITSHLRSLESLIQELRATLLDVKKGCRPVPYYEDVRPWFSGQDSDPSGRKWIFDGLDKYPDLEQPVELSGPSAGQSSLVHAFDAFLGVSNSPKSPHGNGGLSFQQRMRFYMPKPHREFLQALDDFPFPLREFVMKTADPELSAAFNGAVNAMKEWRDSHMIIATLYIVSPARRAEKERAARAAMFGQAFKNTPVLKGTGGTDLVRFLKSVRTNTAAAMIS